MGTEHKFWWIHFEEKEKAKVMEIRGITYFVRSMYNMFYFQFLILKKQILLGTIMQEMKPK
jgi:hypothetical protein